MSLLEEMNQKATAQGVPLSAHLDITWRCNERCIHCYLDHEDKGEMSTAEIKDVIKQLAECGTFFLSISGGEPLLRRDCFEILEYARKLRFNVKLKTNAVMIGPKQAARLKELGIEQVQISIYSHLPEIHDAITKVPGSLSRSLEAIRHLKAQGVKVSITNVLMKQNITNGKAVQKLAKELGVEFVIDPTITPKLDGDRSITSLGISAKELEEVFHTEEFVGNVGEFCAPVSTVDDDVLEGYSCSAGHTLAYISPYGDVFPCVQFPMPCGSLRKQTFREIWWRSEALTELRSVHVSDLPTCSHCSHVAYCTRCPGLAYLEGNMRGPSSADCAKSFARTGVVSAGMMAHSAQSAVGLVQIQGIREPAYVPQPALA
ncbi:MAG: radical SAM protein [Terracidiphilus sp.]|jgi:radical SAM protein with 4Fe4S-binding SPASM domain